LPCAWVPDPANDTGEPTDTVWAGPAFATGRDNADTANADDADDTDDCNGGDGTGPVVVTRTVARNPFDVVRVTDVLPTTG
jgi:hypothetical protein